MATNAVSPSLPIRVAKNMTTHPLAPVNADEIKQAASFVQAQWPAGTDLHFKSITLHEPAKAEVIVYLEAIDNGKAPNKIDRRVMVSYYIRKTVSQEFFYRTRHCPLSNGQHRINYTKLS